MTMHRYSEVLGLPVIYADNGKKAGIVKDVVFNPGQREVMAFLLECKNLTLKKRVIPLKEVLSLGRDAIITGGFSCVAALGRSDFARMYGDESNIIGLRIFSKTGEDLGVVKDVIFDWKTGRIESVEISDGMLQDIIQGRKLLPLIGRVEFGSENLLVEREAVEEMANTGGGIKNRLLN